MSFAETPTSVPKLKKANLSYARMSHYTDQPSVTAFSLDTYRRVAMYFDALVTDGSLWCIFVAAMGACTNRMHKISQALTAQGVWFGLVVH